MAQRAERPGLDPNTALSLAPVLLAALVVVIRAATQSITIDEATAFEAFVQRGAGTIWVASAGNHVLYSLLEELSTTLFGVHVFAVRLPAVLGASLYLGSAVYVCRLLVPRTFSRVVILTALCLNPLILDYLIAARGYSLALGLMMLGVCPLVPILLRSPALLSRSDLRRLAGASVALGASVSANFSFASPVIVLVVVFLLVLYFVARPDRARMLWTIAATSLPGLVFLFVVCGYTLLHWPKGQLVYGANTVGQLLRSVVNASLSSPNGNFLQPEVLRLVGWIADAVPYLLALVLLAMAITLIMRTARGGFSAGPPTRLVALWMMATVIATILAHALLHALFGLLLPKARTASWIVPLVVLALAALTTEELRIRGGERRSYGLVTGTVALLALVNVCCLRLTYFQEWRFDADTAAGYRVLSSEASRLHVVAPVIDWRFNAAFDFYRGQQLDPPVEELAGDYTYPTGQHLYVLYGRTGNGFVAQQHLVPVYMGTVSGMILAEDPGSAAARRGRTLNP